ncbi:tRNA-intron lyase [Candidatus Woesearchaeota archaeon B3_Woes]|nr:MAG: tRNA-intron lyase [Candidatus Woesearchaeota archaeon B3_Woes]
MTTKKKKTTKKQETNTIKPKEPIKAVLSGERVTTENSDQSRELYNQSRYGILLNNGRVQLSLIESAYLLEKGVLETVSASNRKIDFEKFIKKAIKLEPNFWTRYCVFKDIRNRGYIIKTALKFGADFRVYDRGVKPGEDHAKWIVYPVQEASALTWYEFSAKNRVAHSTKKKLLMAVLDAENDVTYWEIKWTRP